MHVISIYAYIGVLIIKTEISITTKLVSSPDPTLSRGKGSGDIGTISWSCTPSRDSIELNVLSHMNAELAQPRNRSNVTRPFSSQRVGSGDETTTKLAFDCSSYPKLDIPIYMHTPPIEEC